MRPALLLLLAATSTQAATPWKSVNLTGFPFVKQKPDFCGEADVEMALRRLGRNVTQDDVFNISGVDPLKGRGVVTDELAAALRKLGFDPGPAWYRTTAANAQAELNKQFTAIHTDLLNDIPAIVCMHYDASPHTTEHFRLVTGYDAEKDEVIYQEPAEDDGANRRMARELFFKLWTFRPSADKVSIIRFRLAPQGDAPKLVRPSAPTPADVSQHVQALKETLPRDMTLKWEKPFLVIGNEEPKVVESRARDVVRWTRDLLMKDFFTEAPSQLEEVWVFKDAFTYRKYSKELFKTDPDTPYGFYLSSRRAMVMNIRPGYGTLTHELVHPFMHENWPDGPAWLNEGLGSLFEQPLERNGHFAGGVNWRLPGLQSALKSDEALKFKKLTHFSDDEFYADDTGVHYAEARYLCYWLQEKGLLVRFVQRAQALKDKDRTGWTALQEVLGDDPDAFWRDWSRFVLGLRSRA